MILTFAADLAINAVKALYSKGLAAFYYDKKLLQNQAFFVAPEDFWDIPWSKVLTAEAYAERFSDCFCNLIGMIECRSAYCLF